MAGNGTCLNESELRALLDGAVAETEAGAWSAHIEACPSCAAHLAALRESRAETTDLMEALLPSSLPEPPLPVAYRKLQQRIARAEQSSSSWKGASLMQRLTAAPRRLAVAGVAIVALMAIVIAWSPVSTMAGNVLNSFRVQQFAAVTVPMDLIQKFDPHAMAETASNSDMNLQDFAKILQGKGAFQTTYKSMPVHQVSSLADASSHLGGSIEVPSNLPAGFQSVQPQIFTGDAGSASYALNVADADKVLNMLSLNAQGLPDPTTTPTVTFSVDIPASAVLHYKSGSQNLFIGQMQSPTLNIPDSVDVNELRDSILAIPGLPTDMVAQIKAVQDWQHTLIVPVPSGATTAEKTVQGAPALLISEKDGAVVLWQKNGNLYAVGGNGLTSDQVMSIAGSMQAQ
ncbi:MAG TPA: hypothetical protein VKU87_11115 [Thermomicrobiaceae bacterium]|nr:hypothetical protein [Thermomicrobiaceae bacterium]